MFHQRAGVAAQPGGQGARRRRVAETFGRGLPLHAPRPEPCSICLEPLCKGELALTLTCGHLYHEGCIHEWLGRKEFCPLCKQPVI